MDTERGRDNERERREKGRETGPASVKRERQREGGRRRKKEEDKENTSDHTRLQGGSGDCQLLQCLPVLTCEKKSIQCSCNLNGVLVQARLLPSLSLLAE